MPSTLPTCYKSNMDLLKEHHPHVWEMMVASSISPIGELFTTSTGSTNLRLQAARDKTLTMHADNPDEDIPQYLALVPENSSGVAILYGMGLGYNALGLLQHRPKLRHLIIFEAEPGIFLQALHAVDLEQLLRDKRVVLSIGSSSSVGQTFSGTFRALRLEDIHFLKHLPSVEFRQDFYTKVGKEVFDMANSFNLDGNTLKSYGHLFMENRFEHLKSIRHHQLLDSLQGAFADIPAIIVAGGPSLDQNIHLLPQVKGKAVIFAVDTVLPALLARGVAPDFLTTIDYQPFIYEKMADSAPKADDQGISLVCAAWSDPRTPKTFPAQNVFWTFTGKTIEQWLNLLLGGSQIVQGSATVAHLNFTAASMLGCSPIIFVGQDLSDSGPATHTKHTFLSGLPTDYSNGPASNRIEAKNIKGEIISIPRAYHSLKITFEQMMASTPNHYINCTANGVHLEGTEVMPLDTAIERYCSTDKPIDTIRTERINNRGPINPNRLLSEFDIALKLIKKIEKLIDKADSLTRECKKKICRLRKSDSKTYQHFSTIPLALQKKFLLIEKIHADIDSHQRIWQLVEESTINGLKESERLRHDLAQLEKIPERYLSWLTKSFDRLLTINKIRQKVLSDFNKGISSVSSHIRAEIPFSDAADNTDGTSRLQQQKLVRQYMEIENIVLAKPLLDQLLEEGSATAELLYDAGIIAALRTEYDLAEDYFKQAVGIDPNYKNQINTFRNKQGDQYLQFARYFYGVGREQAAKKLMLKGLRYCPEHKDLLQSLQNLAQKDLQNFENDPANESNEGALSVWCDDLRESNLLETLFPPTLQKSLYHSYGEILLAKKDFAQAVSSFQKALKMVPESPEIHILLTEALFASQNFDSGLHHLSRAVELDQNYAMHWETLGDDLQASGQQQDALYAYEQCFVSLPQNIGILKKIGDCYMALEQLAAAKEAYTQFKNQLAA